MAGKKNKKKTEQVDEGDETDQVDGGKEEPEGNKCPLVEEPEARKSHKKKIVSQEFWKLLLKRLDELASKMATKESLEELQMITQKLGQDIKRVTSQFDKIEIGVSNLTRAVVKRNMEAFILELFPGFRVEQPVRSMKVKYSAWKYPQLEALASRCLKGEQDETGNHKPRDRPKHARLDIVYEVMSDSRDRRLFLVKVSRSDKLALTNGLEYPKVPCHTPSTKLLFKLVQLERGVNALGPVTFEGAAVASDSFDYWAVSDGQALLKEVMNSPARHDLPNLFKLFQKHRLFLLPAF